MAAIGTMVMHKIEQKPCQRCKVGHTQSITWDHAMTCVAVVVKAQLPLDQNYMT